MSKVLIIVIGTQDYFPLGLRLIDQMSKFYKGSGELYFRMVSDLDPNDYISVPNLEYIHLDAGLGFEAYTMRKIEEMQYVTDEYDYYFIIDADTSVTTVYDDSLFQKDFMCLEHFQSMTMDAYHNPFEKRSLSQAYVDTTDIDSLTYYHACLIGGTYKEMKALSDFVMSSWKIDKSIGCRPVCEDESYLNKYANLIRKPDYTLNYRTMRLFRTGDKGTGLGAAGKTISSILSNEQKQELLSDIKAHNDGIWDIRGGKLVNMYKLN